MKQRKNILFRTTIAFILLGVALLWAAGSEATRGPVSMPPIMLIQR
jgi:hypothetical protein